MLDENVVDIVLAMVGILMIVIVAVCIFVGLIFHYL